MQPSPDAQTAVHCELACTRLCHDFAWAVDNRQYGKFAALFTPDGVFDRAGQVSQGQAQILQFLNARPADRMTRHVCTNVRIDWVAPGMATGSCYTLVFQARAAQEATLPLAVPAPMVVEYRDDYALTPDGWRISHRRVKIIFQAMQVRHGLAGVRG